MDKQISNFIIPFNYTSKPIDIPQDHIYIINRAGCSTVDKGFEISRNSYDYCVVHYIYQGTGLLIVGNEEYRLHAGDIFILTSKEPHMYSSNDEDRLGLLWVEFYGSNSDYLMNIIRNRGMVVINSPESNTTLEKIINISDSLIENINVDLYKNSVLVYDLICSLIKQCATHQKADTIYPPHIKASIQYIKSHINENITVVQLAKQSSCSVSYFYKTFTNSIGVTPLQYIMMNKIEEAKRIMTQGNITCEEVATRLGFYDSSHFTKVYKKYTGQTPKQFKK